MNLIKTVLTFDDGSTQEFDAAPVITPTETVEVTAGESVEVVNTDPAQSTVSTSGASA